MENRIDYVVLSLPEYRALIEENMNKAECIKELNNINTTERKILKRMEQYVWDKITETDEYHLENMKECIPTDYHYQQLYTHFLELGINDVSYINLSIASLKKNFDDNKKQKNNKKVSD